MLKFLMVSPGQSKTNLQLEDWDFPGYFFVTIQENEWSKSAKFSKVIIISHETLFFESQAWFFKVKTNSS